MTIPTSLPVYTQGYGTAFTGATIVTIVAPAASNVMGPNGPFKIGQLWIDTVTNVEYVLTSLSSVSGVVTAVWTAGAGSGVTSLSGTANEITASSSSGAVTLSIPSTFITPGSIDSTSSITSGTSVTAADGNFIASTVGTGLLLDSPTATGAASSPLVLNGRSGDAIFTGVSIAGGASLTLTITNSAITGAATQIIYSLQGATVGSALCISSITNSSGSSVLVVTNGTGATTSVANIALTFLVLN